MAAAGSERRSSVSSIGARSIDSTPRLSIDKRHSTDRRLSTDSSIRTPLPNLPGVSSLPGLSANSPLAAGAAMPPPTPPKDRLPPPMTPTRKPVLRQKSPLSSEAFSSIQQAPDNTSTPGSVMPGAFPNTPSPAPAAGLPSGGQVNAIAYAGNPSPSQQNSTNNRKNAGKRSSSFRNFLPFKALRRSYGNSSTESSPQSNPGRPSTSMSFRPTTPGADSMVSGDPQPTLKHKASASFWRRKSSLGMLGFGSNTQQEQTAPNTNGDSSMHTTSPVSARTNGLNGSILNDGSTLHEDDGEDDIRGSTAHDRPETPRIDEESSGSPKHRKSGTFWRRTSSLTLNTAVGTEKGGWGLGGRKPSMDVNRGTQQQEKNEEEPSIISPVTSEESRTATTMEVPIVLRKSPTPPPQLPPFVGGGGGLGLGDLFKDIQ